MEAQQCRRIRGNPFASTSVGGFAMEQRTFDKIAIGLGWFSIGLGVTELFAGEKLAEKLGLERRTGLLRLFGLREIAAGIGLLASKNRAPWMWARVAGDVLDVALVASRVNRKNPKRTAAAIAVGNLAAVTALDAVTAQQLS
jgi:hypothetical protein